MCAACAPKSRGGIHSTDQTGKARGPAVCPRVTHSTTTSPDETPGDPFDAAERLSADDLATRLEAQGLASALARQQDAAAAAQRPAGVCGNCGERCLPLAKYCDPDCQADHERRLAILRRQGRAR